MERTFLGRYEPIRLLGEGGMGRVYLARQPDLGRQVVVKVMHEHLAADPHFCRLFHQEALLLARFEHPYAVRVYDASLTDPQGPCMIMEYVRGVTLQTLLRNNKGRLHPGRVSRLLGQLCEVLQAAHDARIIHRDLKPDNIMVIEADTPYEKIKVMDFGLAELLHQESVKSSQSDYVLGSPSYVSPEQARGEAMDHRSDLYSVGVILYQMLTGRLPFTGQSAPDVMLAHAFEAPPAFAELECGRDIPQAVETVVRACLAKDPQQRPASARELAERYQQALTEVPEEEAPAVAPAAKTDPEQNVIDPSAVVYHMSASMSRSVAEYKLRGFINDVGGAVLESVPGLIRVRLGKAGTPYEFRTGFLSWLGFGGNAGLLEIFLYLRQADDPRRPDMQTITVLIRSMNGFTGDNPPWRAHCSRIYSDLRGYLMGHDVSEPPPPPRVVSHS